MAVDKEGYINARSKNNGAMYRIGIGLYRKYPLDWEIIPEGVPEQPAVKLETVDEEVDYFELKTKLIDMDIPFKGNAKKEELVKLYNEAIG